MFKRFFKRKQPKEIPPIPNWDKIVEMMQDVSLDAFADEVVRVIYSKDKAKRYVILKDEKGLYTYQLEVIYRFDEDEWRYVFSGDDSLPAMWEPYCGVMSKSVFANEEDLRKELEAEPEYKQYF